MKRIVLLLLAAAVVLPLYAAGGQAGKSSGDTVIKMWARDKPLTYGGLSTRISNLVDGSTKSRHWDTFMGNLDKRGIKLDMTLIMWDQALTAFQTLLATGSINQYDMISAPGEVDVKTRMNLIDQGRLTAINKAIEQYSDGSSKNFYFNTPAGKKFAALESLENGNFYWLSHNMNSYYGDVSNPKGVAVTTMIRQDWLDKLGLPMPKTLDEFYNAVVAFRDKDVNGNGIKDEVVQVNTDTFGMGIATWFGLGNSLISYLDNKAVSPWYQPNARAFFTYMNRLYKAGVLLMTTEGGDMAANRVGVCIDYTSASWNEEMIRAPAGAARPYFNPILIEAVSGTKPRVYDEELGFTVYRGSGMTVVPASSKKIPLAIKMLDYLVSDEHFMLSYYGEEGYSYRRNADGTFTYIPVNDPKYPRDTALRVPDDIWIQGLIPGWRRMDRKLEFDTLQAFGKTLGYNDFRGEYYRNFFSGVYPAVQGGTILAFPTVKEVDRIAALQPDLTTYSSELITALIMGEKSLSNWDAYIADLKRLGLDELLTINQAQVDRGRR